MSKRSQITSAWNDLLDGVAQRKDPAATKWLGLIKQAYNEDHRGYHNEDHINDMLTLFDKYKRDFKDPKAVLAAILFHDIVYVAQQTRFSNEKRSARIARMALQEIGFEEKFTERVVDLIMATEQHKADPKKDPDMALFLDMDMSILAADRGRYQQYTDGVLKEYKTAMDEDVFYRARIDRFLEPMMMRKEIFLTEHFNTPAMTERAKLNLRQERSMIISHLTRRHGGPFVWR